MGEFQGPFSGEVGQGIVTATESGSRDEDNVGTTTESRVHRQHRMMEILKGMMSTGTTTRPLTDDGEGRVSTRNSNDLSERFDRTGLESDILDSQLLEIRDPTVSNCQGFLGEYNPPATSREGTPAPMVTPSTPTPSARHFFTKSICHPNNRGLM
jgi:hypothetical protein